jgi:hypothetical protein
MLLKAIRTVTTILVLDNVTFVIISFTDNTTRIIIQAVGTRLVYRITRMDFLKIRLIVMLTTVFTLNKEFIRTIRAVIPIIYGYAYIVACLSSAFSAVEEVVVEALVTVVIVECSIGRVC